jgi:hypothetical protein
LRPGCWVLSSLASRYSWVTRALFRARAPPCFILKILHSRIPPRPGDGRSQPAQITRDRGGISSDKACSGRDES